MPGANGSPTGEDRPPKRSIDTGSGLTVQEGTKIAELDTGGHSNIEIGARLFISPRTVEYHLDVTSSPKIGINSRMTAAQGLPVNPTSPSGTAGEGQTRGLGCEGACLARNGLVTRVELRWHGSFAVRDVVSTG